MDEKPIASSEKIENLEVEDTNSRIRNICSLPNTILEHLLSLLPMKDAVRTSVLSKQWEFLWTSIPTLEFEESSYSSRKLFMNSVERMLLLHEPCSIKHFSLDCKTMGSASCVKAWVATVVRCNVQNCTIRLTKIPRKFVLPSCLFTCDTLMRLSLDMPQSRSPCSLRLPSQIHLPNLRDLFLRNFMLSDECSTQRLFSSPTLEKLFIIDCSWFHLKAISISSPKLKHLAIDEGMAEETGYCCRVKICNCDLECFYLTGSMLNEYSLSNSSAADVILFDDYFGDDAHVLEKILQEIHAVLKLHFCDLPFIHCGAPKGTIDQLDFPVLSALHTLQLGYFDPEDGVLGKILQRTPHLHTIHVFRVSLDYPLPEEDYKIFDPVPLCFLSSLKKIKVDGLCLTRKEMHVLKNMLKHAMVLEELVISRINSLKDDYAWMEFCEFYGELRGYPRGSGNCNIIIGDDIHKLYFARSFALPIF